MASSPAPGPPRSARATRRLRARSTSYWRSHSNRRQNGSADFGVAARPETQPADRAQESIAFAPHRLFLDLPRVSPQVEHAALAGRRRREQKIGHTAPVVAPMQRLGPQRGRESGAERPVDKIVA